MRHVLIAVCALLTLVAVAATVYVGATTTEPTQMAGLSSISALGIIATVFSVNKEYRRA